MDNIIEDYSNLVYHLTNYFEGYKSKEDLYQAGFIGLITAYKKYDPNYGVKFSTYAYPYILGEMKKLVREDRGIKVSRNLTKLYLKIEKARILLSQQLYRYPTSSELSEYLGIPKQYIEDSMMSTVSITSIDEPICSDEKDISLHEIIADKQVDIDMMIDLNKEIESLDEEEKDILKKRYIEDMTQSEVANLLGMSQVQVSRYEQKIKRKIQKKLAA